MLYFQVLSSPNLMIVFSTKCCTYFTTYLKAHYMKEAKNRHWQWAGAGILLSLLPLYYYLLWVYTAEQYTTHPEAVAQFNSNFPEPLSNPLISTAMCLLLSIGAMVLMGKGLAAAAGLWRGVLAFFLVITGLLAFLLFFSLL